MTLDRRGFLRQMGLATAAVPLLSPDWTVANPDELFTAGKFEAADRGYAHILRADPNNAHAAAQRGYIAVLSNDFARAEKYLTRALSLVPDDVFSRQQLADSFVRQDNFARAVPLLRQTGNEADAAAAEQYAAVLA